MTTLNARASQAWHALAEDEQLDDWPPFASQQQAFEEGWETGYKAARADVMQSVEWLRARAADEAVGTADTRWAYKRAADFLAREIGEEVLS